MKSLQKGYSNLIFGIKVRVSKWFYPKSADPDKNQESLLTKGFGRSNFMEKCENVPAPSSFSRTLSWETEVPAETSGTETLNRSHHTPGDMDQFPDSHSPPDDHLKSIFRKHFHHSVTKGMSLDRTTLLRDAMADCSGGGAFETSDPSWSIFCTQWISAPFLLCQMVLIGNKFIACLRLLMDDSKCTGRHFRFTPLELRGDSSAEISEPGIGGFGLLRNGCSLRSATHADGASLLVDLGEQVGINGWWLTTRDHPAAHDPVRFTVDVSRDGQIWEQCGASRFDAVFARNQLAGIGWSVGVHGTSMQRSATEVFDMALPWQFAADHMLVFLVHLVAHTKVFIAVLRSNPMFAMSVLVYGYSCATVLYLVSAVGYALEGDFLACAVQTTYSALFYALVIWRKRKEFLQFFFILAAGFNAAGFVQYAAVFGGSRNLIDGYRAVVTLDIVTAFSSGCINLFILILSIYLRASSAVSAKALVAADHSTYDATWAVCLKDSDAVAALQRMETLVMGRWGHLRPELLRHQASQADPTVPIESLEQLFAQAAVLLVFLRAKAKGWALRSQGRFPLLQRHGADAANGGGAGEVVFERWEDIAKDPGMVQRVKWAKVKTTKRAAEKIYRCYAGEVARLVDCCRCCAAPAPIRQQKNAESLQEAAAAIPGKSWVLFGLLSFFSPVTPSNEPVHRATRRSSAHPVRRSTANHRHPLSCRCAVVFDEPAEILACLEVIAADKEVEVVRINNRLARDYDAGLSAGYR
jgi:hypothetical protein